MIYADKGDPRAAALASQAYSLAPSPQVADTMGWVLMKSGKVGEGLLYLRRASAALPQNATVQYHLAVALDATGSKGEARTLLEKVIKADGAFDEKADAQKLLDSLQHG
jgi:Flp pilus assembly protein TadD